MDVGAVPLVVVVEVEVEVEEDVEAWAKASDAASASALEEQAGTGQSAGLEVEEVVVRFMTCPSVLGSEKTMLVWWCVVTLDCRDRGVVWRGVWC